MHLRTRILRLGAVLATALVGLAGCATDGGELAGEPSPEASPSPSAAESGTTVSAAFGLLDGRPDGYDDLSGTATLDIGDQGTDGTISLTGLKPETSYVAHVHEQGCDMEGGGPHFKFDAAGSDMPPNEIHWSFTSDAEGSAEAATSNDQAVPDPADRAVVVHENSAMAAEDGEGMGSESMGGDSGGMTGDMAGGHGHQPKIACADLS